MVLPARDWQGRDDVTPGAGAVDESYCCLQSKRQLSLSQRMLCLDIDWAILGCDGCLAYSLFAAGCCGSLAAEGHLLTDSDSTISVTCSCCTQLCLLKLQTGCQAGHTLVQACSPLFRLESPMDFTLQVGIMRRGRYRKGNKIGKAPSATEVGWRTPAE